MGKEVATQVQETKRVPNRINPRQNTPRHTIIKLTKIKHKEQILKAAKGKAINNTQGGLHKDKSWTFKRKSSGQKGMAGHTKSDEREKPITQITVPSNDLIQIWRKNQKLYRQAKAQRIQHHKTSSSTNAKESALDRKPRKGL